MAAAAGSDSVMAAGASVDVGEVKLIGSWGSPFVLRAKIALELKGVEYQNLEPSPPARQSELLLRSNPVYKKIPVLIHDGRPVCESMIIVEYIDQLQPSSAASTADILPSDPYERATARFWAHYIDDKWFPSYMEMVNAGTEEARNAAARGVIELLRPLEEVLAEARDGDEEGGGEGGGSGVFFGGSTIGYVDIALGGFIGYLRATEKLMRAKFMDRRNGLPLLEDWAAEFAAHPAVKGVMPDTDRMIKYREEKMKA